MKKLRLNVLMVTPFFPPLINGVSVYVSHLVRGLVDQGVNVHTQTMSYDWHRGNLQSSDGDLSVSRFRSSWLFGRDTLNQPLSISFIKSTIELANDFDIVHVHDCPKFINDAIMLALKKIKPSKPVIFTPHGTGINSSTHLAPQKNACHQFVVKDQKDTNDSLHNIFSNVYWSLGVPLKVLNSVDHVVTVTPLQSKVYSQVCNKEKISMISEAVPQNYFVNNPAFVEDDRLKVLFIGRVLQEKGLKDLFYAVKTISQTACIELRCIGPDFGFMNEALKIIKKLDIADNVSMLGSLPEDQKLQNLRWCDVLVLPSYHEAFGIPIVEAMAHGKPVIATKTIGAMSLVKDNETGFLVDLCNNDAIADRLLQFIDNSSLKFEMGAKGLKFARSFSMDRMVHTHIDLYKQVARSKINA